MSARGLAHDLGAHLALRADSTRDVVELAITLGTTVEAVLAAAKDRVSGGIVTFDVLEDVRGNVLIRLIRERVVIESPYAGDVEANVAYARACLRDSLLRGESPVASHLLYTQPGVLDDLDPQERACGIAAGLAWSLDAPHVFCTDRGWSSGMRTALHYCREHHIPTHVRTLEPRP